MFRLPADAVRQLTEGLATILHDCDEALGARPEVKGERLGNVQQQARKLTKLLPDFEKDPDDESGLNADAASWLKGMEGKSPEEIATRVMHWLHPLGREVASALPPAVCAAETLAWVMRLRKLVKNIGGRPVQGNFKVTPIMGTPKPGDLYFDPQSGMVLQAVEGQEFPEPVMGARLADLQPSDLSPERAERQRSHLHAKGTDAMLSAIEKGTAMHEALDARSTHVVLKKDAANVYRYVNTDGTLFNVRAFCSKEAADATHQEHGGIVVHRDEIERYRRGEPDAPMGFIKGL
jgi:hypothetical protein